MKKALAVAAIVLALVAAGAYWAYHSLDLIVRVALEHYAPEVAGVDVKVGAVDISARSGIGVVRDLEIGNPAGFTSSHAMRVSEIRVVLEPATLAQPVVRIHELLVDSPVITFERSDRGTNLEAIQKHIQRHVEGSGASSGGSAAAEKEKPAGRRFIVDRLEIRRASVTMTNPELRGQGITFDIPDIALENLGRREGGLTASAIGNIVALELQARIAQKVLTNIELLRKGGVGGALDALKKLLR